MDDQLMLNCPKCGGETMTDREAYDPPAAVRMEHLCPDCCGGDFAEPTYFDAAGVSITSDWLLLTAG